MIMDFNIRMWFLVSNVIFSTTGLQECQDKRTVCRSECNINTGNWKIDNCMKTCRYCTIDNIALNKETRQSSIYTREGKENSLSSNAVDGNIDSDYNRGSCTHTRQQTAPWWCVNLQSTQPFQSFKLYNRDSRRERLMGFSIKVSETGECDQRTFDSSPVCYKDRSTRQQDIYTVDDCNITEGQFVFITVPTGFVTLCEVEILQGEVKCKEGYYSTGTTCRKCNCNGEKCNSQTGVCGECSKNCIDEKCDDINRCTEGCKQGFHGEYCKQSCNSNCNGTICDAGNGKCLNGCIDGYKGTYCQDTCLDNCISCNDNQCTSCKTGWYGDTCQTKCNDTMTYHIIGILSCLLIALIICIVVYFVVRKRRAILAQSQDTTVTYHASPDNSHDKSASIYVNDNTPVQGDGDVYEILEYETADPTYETFEGEENK